MSASNWTTCPRCTAAAHAAKAAQLAAVDAAYGRVPVAEFDRLRAEAAVPVEVEYNVREDYEFYGFSEGKVVAVYGASCKTCGLSLEFKHEHAVPGVNG